MEDVILKLINIVEPTNEERERLDSIADLVFNLVKQEANKFKEVKEVIFGGSYAKDTWLRNDVDVDVFVKIDKDVEEERFEYIGKNIGLNALRAYSPYLRYAQHPYVEANVNGIRVNVVPCYDVKQGEWKSAADRSIYHTKFIKERLNDNMKREVRLLKYFMKKIGIYGAEIKINGFSGYVCEVLILKFCTFLNLLDKARYFKEKEVISIDDNYDKRIVENFNTPLIILDPVDPKRNLGSAISSTNVSRFIFAARRFLEDPHIIFKVNEALGTTAPYNTKLLDRLIVITFNYEKRSEDIIWGQAKHTLNAIVKQLEINNFKVIRAVCNVNEDVTFGILLEDVHLPLYYVKEGPPIYKEKDINRFIKANKDSELLWFEGLRIMCLKKRRYSNAIEFLYNLLTNEVEKIGISKGLINDIKRGFRLYSKDNLNEEIFKNIKEVISSDKLFL